ncbi:hypothetical protein CRENBAI_022044 [Crenichthys baileyi]|uniref:Small membrane A-kinase anchor protein n=1 Tax=Crenichthys baileyi TaxID=28760 RepID=A0AAV9SK67_9TELE
MGCVKSKRSDPASQHANSTEKAARGEKVYLVGTLEPGSVDGSPKVNPVLLEYAQRLSEEIVARAVQQWVEVDSRYSDIPYIESSSRMDTIFLCPYFCQLSMTGFINLGILSDTRLL